MYRTLKVSGFLEATQTSEPEAQTLKSHEPRPSQRAGRSIDVKLAATVAHNSPIMIGIRRPCVKDGGSLSKLGCVEGYMSGACQSAGLC